MATKRSLPLVGPHPAPYTSEEGLRELAYDGPVFADSFPGCPHPDGHE